MAAENNNQKASPVTDIATANTAIQDFLGRWENSGAAERANYQLFLSELCNLLGVAPPDPTQADDRQNAYVFERNVVFQYPDGTSSTKRIDLYKRGCFVLEAKQGSEKKDRGTGGQGEMRIGRKPPFHLLFTVFSCLRLFKPPGFLLPISSCFNVSFSPPATRSCSLIRSTPVIISVTGCST